MIVMMILVMIPVIQFPPMKMTMTTILLPIKMTKARLPMALMMPFYRLSAPAAMVTASSPCPVNSHGQRTINLIFGTPCMDAASAAQKSAVFVSRKTNR